MAASSSSDPNPGRPGTSQRSEPRASDLESLRRKWLAADVDSDESSEKPDPKTQPSRKSKLNKGGRPFGDARFKAQVRAQVNDKKNNLEEVQTETTPGTIEHARAAKAAKHLERMRQAKETAPANTSAIVPSVGFDLCLPELGSVASLDLIGTDLQRSLIAVTKCFQNRGLGRRAEQDDSEDDSALLDFVLDTPSFASQRAIAQILKTPRAKVDSTQTLAGPALLNAHTWMTGALFSCASSMLAQQNAKWQSLAFMTCLRYDETPLKVMLKGLDGFCPQAKVLQCDFKWICLLQNVESKNFCTIESDVLTILHVLDHQTGETLLAATSSVMCVPEIQRFSQCAPILVHHVCTDKHAANMRCENLRSQLPGRELWTKAHLTCDVHRLYRATTCSMKICEADVSGVLSIGLAHQANAGIYRSIVVVLGQIFLEHLQVFYEEPPEQFRPFRESVLDCFVPVTQGNRLRSRNLKRRHIISRLLNGDWEAEHLEHYCQWGCCDDFECTMEKSMRFLAWAIVPGKCPKFCRSRWTRYDEAVDWVGLLSVLCRGKFLTLLMEKTIGKPNQSLKETAAEPPARLAVKDRRQKWEHAALEDCGVLQPGAKPAAAIIPVKDTTQDSDANAGDGQPDWKAFNEKKKTEARTYVATNPGPRLVGMRTVVTHLLSLMLAFLNICSDSWEKKQKAISLRGLPRSYQVLEAAVGTQVADCMNALIDAFHIVPKALPSWGMQRSVRNQVFQMLVNALCGIHALLRVQREGFPFQWFRVLRGEFDHVYSFPHCMHDEFTSEMFQHFHTCETAESAACVAITEAIAANFVLDTVRIEARHASNREQTMQRGRGWQVNMSMLNARFVCMQFATHQGRKKPDQKARQVRKRTKKPSKGGGAWRAFLAHRFKGHRFTKESIKAIANEYRNLSAHEWAFFHEAGVAATLAHKSGHKSFPRAADQTMNAPVENDDLALVCFDHTNLDLEETYNGLKLALFREGRAESQRNENESKVLDESLQTYSMELSVPSLLSELPQGFTAGLQPFPGLSPHLHRPTWRPPIKDIVKVPWLVSSSFI